MKKIMIALAAVACAAGLQASSCDWKLSTGATYASQYVYAFVDTSAQTILDACKSTTASDWTSLVSGLTPVQAGTGARGTASSFVEGVTANSSTLAFLIVNGNIEEGTSWAVVNPAIITSTYEPPAGGTAQTFALGTPATGTFTAAGPTPTPEPTSGLLLVLGMAGLALRRRRA